MPALDGDIVRDGVLCDIEISSTLIEHCNANANVVVSVCRVGAGVHTERFGVTYNDFEFGVDPQSPKGWAGQPTAKGQTRTQKDSSRWLQAVWTQTALVNPRPFFANYPRQSEAKPPPPTPGGPGAHLDL